MRKAPVLIALFFALLTAGCVGSGKPGKPAAATPAAPNPVAHTPPAPPPQPLSIPQTQVELPKPQPVDPAAFAAETAPPVEVPPDPSSGARPTGGRGGQPRAGAQQQPQQRVESAAPPTPSAANAPAATPPAATAPAETPQPTIQEIVSPGELKRSREQAQALWKDVNLILDQIYRRGKLTPAQEEVVTSIKSFLESSMAAEKKGDVKVAELLAERAQIKAKDLLNGR